MGFGSVLSLLLLLLLWELAGGVLVAAGVCLALGVEGRVLGVLSTTDICLELGVEGRVLSVLSTGVAAAAAAA